ncbi:MAG: hypothetical protein LBD77_06745 [Bifidobacteriaceae bacterium]|jgi:major membrane immunogen (membrane-anchored lipoprotein)|nr:hypothetical protein [Bifidobacteriaceae bacterium]
MSPEQGGRPLPDAVPGTVSAPRGGSFGKPAARAAGRLTPGLADGRLTPARAAGRPGRLAAPAALAALAAVLAGCGGPSVDTDKPLADGTYAATSGEDEDGAIGRVTIEVSGGAVVACEFDVILEDGTPKDENYGKDSSGEVANDAYYAKAQAAVAAFDRYAAELIAVGYPQEVDVISGATWAHEQFVEGAVKAMRQAQEAWAEDPE